MPLPGIGGEVRRSSEQPRNGDAAIILSLIASRHRRVALSRPPRTSPGLAAAIAAATVVGEKVMTCRIVTSRDWRVILLAAVPVLAVLVAFCTLWVWAVPPPQGEEEDSTRRIWSKVFRDARDSGTKQ